MVFKNSTTCIGLLYTPKNSPIKSPPDILFFNQQSHAAALDKAYKAALNSLEAQYQSHGLDPASVDKGVAVEFQFRPGTKIDVTTLENAQGKKIEVLNVKLDPQGNPESAIIYIPPERKKFIEGQIMDYGNLSKQGKNNYPQNYKKYDKTTSIEPVQIGRFWIDKLPLPQDATQPNNWEVWLREEQFETFKANAHKFGDITVSAHHLKFPERQICSVRCSLESLEKIELVTKAITGFRFLWTQAGFFDALPLWKQKDWSEELSSRLIFNQDAEYSVCVLDTGLAVNHPLLKSAIAKNGVDSCNPQDWGSDDHEGHGTEMAGIALFGDLTPLLEGTETIEIRHLIESVKVFPPKGINENEHIGYITAQAVSRAEINRPNMRRVFCLSWSIDHKAQTINIQVTEGKPTPLSAKIDQLAFGVEESGDWHINDDRKRLMIVSAGNIRESFHPDDYPSVNDLYEIEDPAQAWNALSVGAYTDKTFTTDPTYNEWSVLAGIGQLSPKSRTSVLWGGSYWPTKPDIVLEGGNYLSNGSYFEKHPDTCLLTTNKEGIFSHTADTSAANAEAARLAAILASQYPEFWPESIRGLLVQSAEWTKAMLNEKPFKNKAQKIAHLRRYGYGVPQLNVLVNSFSNRPCVVIQDYLQPFAQSKSDSIVFKDMNYYVLPWPGEQLEAIVGQTVKLRVTLSYFIEPSPSERPPKTKYSYASHELRFKLNRPNETKDGFLARINKELQIAENNEELSGGCEISDPTVVDEQDKWLLGPASRDRGSLISDIWEGTGPELATQNLIAVVPQRGWWKFRKNFPDADNGRYNQRVRYSLILSLICETEVDLYTPIAQKIEMPIEIIV